MQRDANLRKVGLARRCFHKVLADPAFAAKVEPMLAPPRPEDLLPPKPSAEPLRLLALLQRQQLPLWVEHIEGETH